MTERTVQPPRKTNPDTNYCCWLYDALCASDCLTPDGRENDEFIGTDLEGNGRDWLRHLPGGTKNVSGD
jgi:hypothetical protein